MTTATDMFASLTSGVGDDQYHADKVSLSSTGARKILDCPARFKWEIDNPPKSTAVFDFGKLVHRVILGEGAPIQIVEADNWLTKAAKAERDSAREDGAIPVLRSEYDTAQAMRESVMAHRESAELFSEGIAERSGWFSDEPTGTTLRFRPDWLTIHNGRPTCVDLKTTANAKEDDLIRSIVRYGYHAQADFYLRGLAAHGIEDARFVFVFVEKSAPYCVDARDLDEVALTEGAYINRRAIDLFHECTTTGIWPAYGDQIRTISLPPWATRGAMQAQANELINQLEGITA